MTDVDDVIRRLHRSIKKRKQMAAMLRTEPDSVCDLLEDAVIALEVLKLRVKNAEGQRQ